MSVAEGETIYFLDTSALAKLYHQEQGSEMVGGWAADHTIRLWLSDLARIELHSSFVRKVREGELAKATLQTVLECFRGDLRSRFHILSPTPCRSCFNPRPTASAGRTERFCCLGVLCDVSIHSPPHQRAEQNIGQEIPWQYSFNPRPTSSAGRTLHRGSERQGISRFQSTPHLISGANHA